MGSRVNSFGDRKFEDESSGLRERNFKNQEDSHETQQRT